MEILYTKDLSFTYPLKREKALNEVNISINEGEFIVLCGSSGSGKTTLLKHFKPILTPHGRKEGIVGYKNRDIAGIDEIQIAHEIGYVSQNPDNQIVTDKVWHELAFAMESLGYDSNTIRLRVAEMASFFGITDWFYRSVLQLSGGQKQLLNLASVMTLKPRVLILDEPLSQLDPVACNDFLNLLKKINEEIGATVILSEHRLHECVPLCDRLVVMDSGKIIADDSPKKVCKFLKDMHHPMFYGMTPAMKIYSSIEDKENCPITVKEGRSWINSILKNKNIKFDKPEITHQNKNILSFKDVWFKYEKKDKDVLKNLSFNVNAGEIYAIVGGNGTGKTTTISLLSGLYKPYRGKVLIEGKAPKDSPLKIALLPQDPFTIFTQKTVKEEIYSDCKDEKRIEKIMAFVTMSHLMDRHPYDLSGGEAERLALAKVLLLEPDILLLDEPTKGVDDYFKMSLAKMLRTLCESGVTIIMVSHDIEFCAKYTDRCGLFFDGQMISEKLTRQFFIDNSFYTTVSNRMIAHLCKDIVTDDEVIHLCKSI